MVHAAWLLGLTAVLQVPEPGIAEDRSAGLRAEWESIRAQETKSLQALADRLTKENQPAPAKQIRALLDSQKEEEGATRFRPLADVVPANARGLANVPAAIASLQDLKTVYAQTTHALFDVASKAANAQRFALADRCLRAILDRDPNHAEARRLLGFVPYEGGWATPFAAKMLTEKHQLHPIFGWVPANWVPHLDRGELPAPPRAPGQKEVVWLPAAEADVLHRDWSKAWKIDTEHFHVETNVPLSEAIAFGRLLEDFHELFFAIMADVVAEDRLPLAQRFRKTTAKPPPRRPHLVSYFASKDEYVAHLSPILSPEIAKTLGVYLTPKEAKPFRLSPMSFFFRDPDGQLEATATLYHEVSHQLLFEAGGSTGMDKNRGNFWVFEGMGTYFETVTPQPDGSILCGGLIGPRIADARVRLFRQRQYIPLAQLVNMSRDTFSDSSDENRAALRYAEAMALAIFFMQAEDGRYREGFLDYLKKAYRGQLNAGSSHSLSECLGGTSYGELDGRFRQYLLANAPPSETGAR
jgi:hypothetical protein